MAEPSFPDEDTRQRLIAETERLTQDIRSGTDLLTAAQGLSIPEVRYTHVISLPVTDEMLEDFGWPDFQPPPPGSWNDLWKTPTRWTRLRWRVRQLRSRCIDAWAILTGRAELRDDYDYDEED